MYNGLQSALWGDQGYMLMARNLEAAPEGQCGIAMAPSYPVKKDPNPQRHEPTPAEPASVEQDLNGSVPWPITQASEVCPATRHMPFTDLYLHAGVSLPAVACAAARPVSESPQALQASGLQASGHDQSSMHSLLEDEAEAHERTMLTSDA